MRAFGASEPTQVAVWEQLMDAKTLLLTANTETVYAVSHLALREDGPTVIEAPPHMLGFIQDGLQRYLADIGPLGPDKGQGGKFLVLPPGFDRELPDGYFVARSPTYSAAFAVRGFQVDGSTDQAVELMKQIRIYPLADAASPPTMEFINGSGQDIDTLFPDNFGFFELLAMIVDEEPPEIFGPLERWLMQAIGIKRAYRSHPTTTPKPCWGKRRAWAGRWRGSTPTHHRLRMSISIPTASGRGRWRGELHLPQRRHPANRCPQLRLLHGRRELPGDDGQERRPGLAIPLDLPRRRW